MSTPLHVEHTLIVKASLDVAGTQGPLNRDDKVVFDSYQNGGSVLLTVAAAPAVDTALPMLGVASGKLLFLEVEQGYEVTIKLNGVDAIRAIAVKANPTGIGVGRFFLETTGVTAAYITNPASETIRVWWGIFGD